MSAKIGPHASITRTTAYGNWQTSRRIAAGYDQQQLAVIVQGSTNRSCNTGRICDWERGKGLGPDTEEIAAVKAAIDPEGPDPPAYERAAEFLKPKHSDGENEPTLALDF